jgi:hypothetical protein
MGALGESKGQMARACFNHKERLGKHHLRLSFYV